MFQLQWGHDCLVVELTTLTQATVYTVRYEAVNAMLL